MRFLATLGALTSILLAACSSPGTSVTTDGGAADSTASGGGDDGGAACLFCSDASDDQSLALQVKGRIDQICASTDGCHGSGAGGMGLSLGNELAPMINVVSTEEPPMLRVAPGDPAHSYVYLKLACEGGIDGGCMPAGSPPEPALAKLFHDWIEAGAPTQ